MPNEAKQLTDILVRIVENRKDQPEINPVWLATEAMTEIDPERVGPDLEYLAAHLHLRQMLRGMLAKKFDPTKADIDLFPETIQDRYPRAHTAESGEPVYVVLALMTAADVDYNVARLRKEGRAKIDHADALQAWWRLRHGEDAAD